MEIQVDNAAFLQELPAPEAEPFFCISPVPAKYFKGAVTKLAIHSGPPPPEQG
jgi:hypothetical protein